MTLSPGDHVDRYEVLARLGSGGMGEVFRARDPKLERDVALKIVRVDSAWGTEGGPRLLREARAVAALSHPNVLAVFDVGEVHDPPELRGLAYIAMELVIGKPLRSFVGDPSVPMDRRIGWLRDVARGLAAAHDAGLVHRDVKPENVMVRDDGVVKVLDFGIARRSLPRTDLATSTEGQSIPGKPNSTLGSQPTVTALGVPIGTPFYMAPEQLRAEELDGRADQFAWGVVAYELLTGSPPWKGAEPVVILSEIFSRNPPLPAVVDDQIPVPVSDAILRALSKEASARFPTMHDLLGALDADGRTIERAPRDRTSTGSSASSSLASARASTGAVPSAISTPHAPPARRRWWRSVAGAVTVAIVLAASVFVAARFGKKAPPAQPRELASAAGPPLSNAACSRAHDGGQWRFSETRRECVELTSPDCKVFAAPGDFERPDTVWIGALYPMTGPEAAGFAVELNAVDLARRDFADALGGSVARDGSLHARPIAVVACDEAVDPTRAARHLVEDVQVPAVIGFRSGRTAREIIPAVFLPAHVLAFISVAQSAGLNKIPEPSDESRLIWRSTLDADDIVLPIAALVEGVLEPRVRAEGLGSRPLKIALVHSHESQSEFASEVLRELRFNGKTALANGDNLRHYIYDERSDAEIGATVRALLDLAPQVVIFWGYSTESKILAPLEARWSHGPRPIYVTAGLSDSTVAALAGTDVARHQRLFGATNATLTMTNAQLVLHYNQTHSTEPVIRTEAPQPSYDAFYMLAYATEALGEAPITGPALSAAFAKLLPPGKPIDVGPADIFDGFKILRTGGNIDLNGAIGALDFDPATGEAPIDYEILCPGVNERGVAQGAVESGLIYEAGPKKLVGTLHCP